MDEKLLLGIVWGEVGRARSGSACLSTFVGWVNSMCRVGARNSKLQRTFGCYEGFSIRRGLPGDNAVARALAGSQLGYYGLSYDPNGRDTDIRDFGLGRPNKFSYYVAEVDCVIAGIGASRITGIYLPLLGFIGRPRATVTALYVARPFLRRGIGRAILHECIEDMRSIGFQELGLNTSSQLEAAVMLYRATGWIELPVRPNKSSSELSFVLDLTR